ncbi:Peptidase A22B signal peptide peptidase [Penicillium alfredii]|uniref:Peptidase A22B signal peptide peptidase n=1 Tax=Penicillium alfredii TaxID=1506179 RepID=A0A9W9F309_9EURO|nr:Peptidase A22B signal peptide peptidase [Penicillium alfredii]KAJ5092614.1 Peptidase A22B signal peptide peptidase [Penicillium alfredii]
MSEVSPLAELLGQALYHFDRVKPLLPTYGHLLVSALFPIWIGSHSSLSRPSSAAKPPKKKDTAKEDSDTEDDTEDEQGSMPKMEGLEPSDALMFPLTAGLTLGGLYMVIKWLEDPAILNKILSFYFSQMGLFFAIAFLKDSSLTVRSFFFPAYYRHRGQLWRVNQSERVFKTSETGQVRHSPLPGAFGTIPLPGPIRSGLWTCRNAVYQQLKLRTYVRGLLEVKTLVGLLDLFSGIAALCAVGYFAFVTKPWWLTNFLGFSFCYGALQFMSPSTFWTGTLILGSLFFYDIYFVFFTPLMVTVATKLDVPIKLLFPRPPTPSEAPDAQSLAMLGLGDIVIPGLMIGLALRFDLFLYYQRKGAQKAQVEGDEKEAIKPQYQKATGAWGERFWSPSIVPQELELQPPYHDARSFPKIYFNASLIGYVTGMVTTLLAMQYSNHAQPALLYLVPGVLGSLWGTAFFRGETRSMWDFSDAEVEESEEKTDEKKEEDKDSTQGPKSLFMRILSGDLKSLTSSEGPTQEKKNEDKTPETASKADGAEKDKSGAKKDQDKKTRDDKDVISISLSFHRKSKPATDSASKESASEDDEMVTVSGAERDTEPPLKRRRRSLKAELEE